MKVLLRNPRRQLEVQGPMRVGALVAAGNRHLQYKEMLNSLEVLAPGAKHVFYHGFLERCGGPTPSDVCAFCRLVERTGR